MTDMMNLNVICCISCCCLVGNIPLLFFIGDPKGTTHLDVLYRLLFVHLPTESRKLFRRTFGNRCDKQLDSFIYYLCYTNNSCAQIFYLVLMLGGYGTFMIWGYPLFPVPTLSNSARGISFVGVVICICSFIAVSLTDPGTITPDNVDILEQLYSYDSLMFPKGLLCTTCNTIKIARSKHCRLCNRCVAKFDHHCIWVGNCIGFNNYHLFLFFLLFHTLFVFYGSIGCFLLLKGVISNQRLWEARFIWGNKNRSINANWTIIIQYLITNYWPIVYLWVCCLTFAIVLCCFSTMHFYQAFISHSTSNESCRRSRLRDELLQHGGDPTAVQNIYRKKTFPLMEVFFPNQWARLQLRRQS